MVLWVLRGLFVILMISAALAASQGDSGQAVFPLTVGAAIAAFVLVGIDAMVPRKSLAALSGAFLGLLVGMVSAVGLGLIVDLLASVFGGYEPSDAGYEQILPVISAIKLMIGVICCYLAISFILQTKDDVRFVIPYVEFSRQMRGARPMILDTSVIIDGRIADICETRIIDSPLYIPRFVLQELQTIADSPTSSSATAAAAAWTCSTSSRPTTRSRSASPTPGLARWRGRRGRRPEAGRAGQEGRRPRRHERLQPQQDRPDPRRRRHQHQRPGQRTEAGRHAGRAAARADHQAGRGVGPGRRLPRRRHDGRGRELPRQDQR
jgi:hypothetical protein